MIDAEKKKQQENLKILTYAKDALRQQKGNWHNVEMGCNFHLGDLAVF